MEAVNEHLQHCSKSTPYNKDHRRLDLFGHKSYISATLHFRIPNHQALIAKYNYLNHNKFNSFIDHVPEEHHDHFKAIIQDGPLLSKTSLQVSLDAADTATQPISTAVVIRKSWLQLLGFQRDV